MSEAPFSIESDGDDWEKRYWEAFASERFRSYEDFWLAHVVPLTRHQDLGWNEPGGRHPPESILIRKVLPGMGDKMG